MILVLDIGNTHVHAGLATPRRVVRRVEIRTVNFQQGAGRARLRELARGHRIEAGALCSVVPKATPLAQQLVRSLWAFSCAELSAKSLRGLGIHYPKPATIGPDRLANALASKALFGAPAVVVDFGTAVTFDVVDRDGDYVGGIIAPGLGLMTSYLHEKTALLPEIQIRGTREVIGKSTAEAMLVGAVRGYRGLVRELVRELKGALGCRRLPVVATGGYARLMAAGLPEITAVRPGLTLEGLRLWWSLRASSS